MVYIAKGTSHVNEEETVVSALEAMEKAKETEVQADPKPEVAKPAHDFASVLDTADELDKAAGPSELAQLRQQNRELLLRQVPPEHREALDKLLDLRDAARYLEAKGRDVANRERALLTGNIAKEYGIDPEILADIPTEAGMRKLAEKVKGMSAKEPASGEDSADKEGTTPGENPPAMKGKPAVGASGQTAPAPLREKFKRTGDFAGFLRAWGEGQE